MRIAKKQGTVKLNGDSPEFAGTMFAGHDFELEVKQVNKVERARIRRNFAKAHKGKKASETDASQVLFGEVLVSFKGFENEEGKPLPCNASGKQFLWENCPELVDIVVVAATSSRILDDDGEDVEETEEKNS